MAFSYDLTGSVGKVRFHVGDTREEEASFTDEEIMFAISAYGENGSVIRLIQRLIADIQASFSGGGLSVNNETRLKALKMLLAEKRNEFGIFNTPKGKSVVQSRSDNIGGDLGEELLSLGIDPDTDRLYRNTYRRFD